MTVSTGERGDYPTAGNSPNDRQGDVPADTFAARLLLARHHAGRLSIEKAAERCGLNSGNWVRWEDGARPRDKVEVAQAVSDGLGVSFDWLLLGGPLLSAKGRLTRRAGEDTARYSPRSVRTIAGRTNGGPRVRLTRKVRRGGRSIDRTQPVAA